MLTLCLFSFSALADDFTARTRVDPYEVHLQQLADLLDSTPDFTYTTDFTYTIDFSATNSATSPESFSSNSPGSTGSPESQSPSSIGIALPPMGQADDGILTIRNLAGVDVATVWAETVGTDAFIGDQKQEHWLYHDASFSSDPGAPFVMEMLEPQSSHGMSLAYLDAVQPNTWTSDPYAPIGFHYKTKPSSVSTKAMTFQGAEVTRHAFVLVQSTHWKCKSNDATKLPEWCLAGAMMREHHQVNGNQTFYEHWVFFEGFELVADEGDTLRVLKSSKPAPKTTAAFFDALPDLEVEMYAQPKYTLDLDGSDFESL